jgi:RNA polymerase-binding transcription factor DksA
MRSDGEIKARLELELRQAMERLRQQGGAIVIEEFPGAIGDNSPFANPMDEIQVNEEREVGFATRSLLVERANRLAEALDRLRRGSYGLCEECGEAIAPARLNVMPEVTTCVRCQDRLERLSQRLQTVGGVVSADDEDDE